MLASNPLPPLALRARWRSLRSWEVVRPALRTSVVVGLAMTAITLGEDLALPWPWRVWAGVLMAFAVPLGVSLFSRSSALAVPVPLPAEAPLWQGAVQWRVWAGALSVGAVAGTLLLWVTEWRLGAPIGTMELPATRGVLIYLVPTATSLFGRLRVLAAQRAEKLAA